MRPWSISSLLRLRCPACGADSFRAGLYSTAKACARCGQAFERESGFFAGAIYPFYAGAVLVGGAMLAGSCWGLGWSLEAGLVAAGLAVLLASPWLFWYSRLSFLHTDHRFFREEA
jgi:uncharacterized protein (DUF983 family)